MDFPFYRAEDRALDKLLEQTTLLKDVDPERLTRPDCVKTYEVTYPTTLYSFLHEAAVIEYHGTLFASWYNCPQTELHGDTPIRGRRSHDGGKTWTDTEVLARDESGKILYCPPVYGICGDRLYLMMNEMVAPDHIHALDLYIYNEETERFEFLWSRPIPFKLNTNVYQLPNGKLMLPGRVAELDGFPNTPAVLISDSGKIDDEWRLVTIQPDGALPDGSKLVHPELSAIVQGEDVYMFCRDDERRVPLIYISHDCGETWSAPMAHDIPFCNAKIYSGTLSDGRNYVMGNIFPPDVTPETGYPRRNRLAAFFSRPNTMIFDKGIIIEEDRSPDLLYGMDWTYPVACEADGTLYVIYSSVIEGSFRGAALSAIDLKAL